MRDQPPFCTPSRRARLSAVLVALSMILVALPAFAAPPSYDGIQLGMTQRQLARKRALRCKPKKHGAKWCSLRARGDEARAWVWFWNKKVASVDVRWKEKVQKPHATFIAPFIEKYGPPAGDNTMPIPMGPNAGETLSMTTWSAKDSWVLMISSRRAGPYDLGKHRHFELVLANPIGGLMDARDKWMQEGLPLPDADK